ncbi:tRNA guanosine(15) transglycosylase TgtA [Salinarchaeum sp. IM2453]|uniref:tRNA guanosine(15) transglycosylase TgtA n=1 Tax=Salinarchaeum sp. IM2453 TaxID=2862870 RepID=UPI001C82A940|nr:tRNA guanosine(15) transglycosylase TgtA [Salinarchaeum sp. IM2453]QZA87651.1 tRNA guanosine(15) transglycosylase TgtA [Salinarchaeum sp. IM2453]
MDPCFEINSTDAAGRIGTLTVPRNGQEVTTPALLPVINPGIKTIPPSEMESEFGAEILITNSYIIHSNEELREEALEHGLHDWLDFTGAIMTDSGSFQLSEYGSISVTTEEILQFQHDIGTDIATPIDIPTPPDVDRSRAESELQTTLDRLEIAESFDTGEMLVTGPVQGSTYPDLRTKAGKRAKRFDLDVYPIGAVVPLLEEYRFADIIDLVVASKKGLQPDAPVHLFGAGHPMMFALTAAAGCDLFDSAAYALYARDGRYLTVRGTKHLEDLRWLPCSCPVCTEYSAKELQETTEKRQEELLARHNLYVSFEEIDRVKQAIHQGNLLELVEKRARAHPAILDGYRRLLDHAGWLERSDPATKETFFYLSSDSAQRPEIYRHQERLDRISITGTDVLLTEGEEHERYDQCLQIKPPFGPVPKTLAQMYPFTAEVPDQLDQQGYDQTAQAVRELAEQHSDVSFTVAHDNWPESALGILPDSIDTYNLTGSVGSDR